MNTLRIINAVITVLFFLCYAYQFIYIPIALKPEKHLVLPAVGKHHFAILICARNEQAVIGNLIDSLHAQTYDGPVDIFVMADNCSDATARVAFEKGAHVYTRLDNKLVGKGYALRELTARIREDYPRGFDAYIVFDADNLLSPDYLMQMNRTFCKGYDIITSYRNSLNYGDNWISAGYALWFLRESRFLNYPRSRIGCSCLVSGTGFLFSRRIAEELADWPYHLLTEDIEFSADQITKGRKIGFCREAELFDEQPTRFTQSWHQRMRWSKGYIQVFRRYGRNLVSEIFRGNFSCFDMTMSIMPAIILTVVSILGNLSLCIWGVCIGDDIMIAVGSVLEMFAGMYSTFFLLGLLTAVSEWNHIHTSTGKKILSLFTFPLFMLTYIPIAVCSLFVRVEWKPIQHGASTRIRQISGTSGTH